MTAMMYIIYVSDEMLEYTYHVSEYQK